MAEVFDVEALYKKHRAKVYHVALRYAHGNIAWAEDITHDVFVKLCGSLDSLENVEALGGWLYRITSNLCLNRLERDRFIQATPVRWMLAQKSSPKTPEVLVNASREMLDALQILRELPPKQSVVFCMKHLDGKDQVEIAQALGFSKGYVSKLLKRAEERVRRHKPEGYP